MIINTTGENIQQALDEANRKFNGNLVFNNFQRLSNTRYRVTLKVKDSRSKGARLHIHYDDPLGKCEQKTRHGISACWHAHGTFLDSLPEGTRIVTRGKTTYPGNGWEDFNVGSQMFPVYMSESCEC